VSKLQKYPTDFLNGQLHNLCKWFTYDSKYVNKTADDNYHDLDRN